jgi:filamentous hemagglutinin family protein
MTPSPTRADPPRTASRRAPDPPAGGLGPVRLLGRRGGDAGPAGAGPDPAGHPGRRQHHGLHRRLAPAITAPNANTLDVDLNAPRTVINWASLHVSGADSMIFHFDANSDIVLNKTTSQIAIDAGGTVSGLVGASAGGNIWFYSPQGVIVSPGAVMTGGGFLFSRGAGIVDAGFVDAADPLANLRAATNALIRITRSRRRPAPRSTPAATSCSARRAAPSTSRIAAVARRRGCPPPRARSPPAKSPPPPARPRS